ncbi:alpha/beta hydrolase-fold protein [soil metagenome]
MKKIYISLFLSVISILSACSHTNQKEVNTNTLNKEWTVFSKAVQDSFVISIQLPEQYNMGTKTNYPTAYILDANFHFLILASTKTQYEKGGILPPIILIGIGYKSFELMDSLRTRDYLYPAALPSDEINAIGGGNKFYDFIANQLIPYIDSTYKTDKTNRSLLGHSFGGYFSLYALLNQAENGKTVFKNFAAASPSLWYNNFYLNQLAEKLKNRTNKDTLNIFTTVGGLENAEWDIAPGQKLADSMTNIKDIKFQHKVFSDLGHMDVPAITFTKALQAFYTDDK